MLLMKWAEVGYLDPTYPAEIETIVDWEDETTSMVWLSTLESIEPKRFNIRKFLFDNNIISEYARLIS